MSDEIAFIGLGSMGAPMAANLLAAGVKLRVWNRTAGKAAPLIAQGATLAATPAEAIAPGGVAITMLADDAAVETVTLGDNGLAARLGAGGIHVSMSTIAPRRRNGSRALTPAAARVSTSRRRSSAAPRTRRPGSWSSAPRDQWRQRRRCARCSTRWGVRS